MHGLLDIICYYYELWGEECNICLQTDADYYFINECSCKHLICLTCVSKLTKCPFCRKQFSNETLYITTLLHDLEFTYTNRLITAAQYWDMTDTEIELTLAN